MQLGDLDEKGIVVRLVVVGQHEESSVLQLTIITDNLNCQYSVQF